jgi:LPXTG-site transpeptidase (sortase) family protein
VTRIKRFLGLLGAVLAGSSLVVVPAATPLLTGSTAHAAPLPGQSKFTQVAPFRLVDTRTGGRTDDGQNAGTGVRAANSILQLQVGGRGGVPVNATAVVLNVTAAASQGAGYVTVFPGDQGLPNTSNVNVERPDQTVANLVTVQLGQAYVNVYTSVGTQLIVDVFGYYAPSGNTSAGRFVAYGPERIIDTREGGNAAYVQPGQTKVVPLPAVVPKDAIAAVVNITVTDGYPGYWTAFAAGSTRPSTSNVNIDITGRIVPNQAIVPVSATGIAVYSEAGGHLLIDLAGWYTGASAPSSGDGLFVPITPQRLLDTRTSPDPLGVGISLFHDWSMEMPVIGQAGIGYNASAVALNLTATNSFDAGYVSAWPAGQPRPNTSSLNLNRGGQTVAGHVTMRVGEPGIGLYSYGGTDLIADVFGWFTGLPAGRVTYQPANQTPPAVSFPGFLEVPSIGLSTPIGQGVDGVDQYPGHLTESSAPNQPGNVAIFGHRVSHRAQFRYLDRVPVGATIKLTVGSTRYVYQVTGTDIVSPDDVSLYYSGSLEQSITLIACHPPTSVAYRIVVRGDLVRVESA